MNYGIKAAIALFSLALLSAYGDVVKNAEDDASPAAENTRDRRSLKLVKHHVLKHWLKKTNPKHWLKEANPKHWLHKTHPGDWLSDVGSTFQYSSIYPGTKWCGDGNRARSWADVGRKWRTDTCCRDHDHCSRAVEAGHTNYGIRNYGLFTWSHCECDREFYECLKHSRCLDSDIIGVTYFDVLNNYCIYEDYPVVCKKFLNFKVKCTKVRSGRKVWQKKKIGLTYLGHH